MTNTPAPPKTSFERQVTHLRSVANRSGWRFGESMSGDAMADESRIVLIRQDGEYATAKLVAMRVTGGKYQIEYSTGTTKAKRGVNALNMEGEVTDYTGHRLVNWDGRRSFASNEIFPVLRGYIANNASTLTSPQSDQQEIEMTDTPTGALLPCPFCGSAPVMFQQGNDQTAKRRVTIKCKTCRAERTDAALRNNMAWLTENAVANWNTRPTLERDLTACRAALRLAELARIELAALVPSPSAPDFTAAIPNPADAMCVQQAYDYLQQCKDAARAILPPDTGEGEGK